MKSQQDFMREFVEKIDEIVRGAFVQQQAPNSGYSQSVAIRPSDQAERDMLAKGIKTARQFNKNNLAYTKQTDNPHPQDVADQTVRARGALSGTVYQKDDRGAEDRTGMPVDLYKGKDPEETNVWQTGVVSTKRPDNPKFSGPVSRNDGKATAIKKPTLPW